MSNKNRYESWGRYPKTTQEAVHLYRSDATLTLPDQANKTALPFGNGRSYGDVCLNDHGTLIDCQKLNQIISFDAESGLLLCESGVLLADILKLIVPSNWFLPVTPGTQFVTVGGAIANDVHGKNHHRTGTFGKHVLCFELLRSDGSRICCSAHENPEWFQATIGGLGLTGVISWAKIQLKPIASPYIDQEIIRYANLSEFFSLSQESDTRFEYTVAWVDCLAQGSKLGRGLFFRGNHAKVANTQVIKPPAKHLSFPIDPPFSLINNSSLWLFNTLYYHKQMNARSQKQGHYQPFFYPLDSLQKWNRIYGHKGLLQYQCVIPHMNAEAGISEILKHIAAARCGSFLAVLKVFGEINSPGLLSFPRPGVTLALDFPNQGQATFALLERLDALTRDAGGAVYPAKDARMSAQSFQSYYPHWQQLSPFIDPRFSSSFWRRVTAQ
ncbi:MAG: FAD-binding protein [Methyloprofundus sp.]|nr:FAD-binding protein [Methyloprofundus sp.]